VDALDIQLNDSGLDDEELASVADRLRGELLGLDVYGVESVPREENVPPGAKGLELAAVGSVMVKFIGPEVLKSVVSTVRTWFARQKLGSIEITLDGDTLKLTGVSTEDQERLIELWVARHADPR
jgi:hypothetical protein